MLCKECGSMETRWMLVTDSYEGIEKRAVNLLYAAIAGYFDEVLPVRMAQSVTQAELEAHHVIWVEKNAERAPQEAEGYAIEVGESAFRPGRQMVRITGHDAAGVLYGCMDFCGQYCGNVIYKNRDLWSDATYDHPFEGTLNPWKTCAVPAIKTRALWTWGHVIYDYRKYLDNMARLRLNEIVIWNDVVPLNARDVVAYAHELNIRVVWGFSWGWGVSCAKILENYNEDALLELKREVMETYEREYLQTGCDGIYFQSFTELHDDQVNGLCIADQVTQLVNCIAGALLEKYPDLHIQFGLHATSVKNHLDALKKVDRRVHIVWEDCGSFPYHYEPDRVADFEETAAFTREIAQLRGREERFGAVFKGMLKLDWGKFEHFSQPYILGERTDSVLHARLMKKSRIWKTLQADWLKNAECVRKMIEWLAAQDKASEGKASIIEALVEDGVFEQEIMLPVALYAQMLWTPDIPAADLIGQVAKYPHVRFANV